ncbi:MAG: fibronectin type III domain-containing protein, partial [Vicinamibacterales bacterium]
MKPALTALMLLLTAGAAAQSLPTLTGGPDDYTLTVPYVEYGSGPARQAFTVRLESADLRSFRLSAASQTTPRPLAAGTRLVTVSGGPPYRLSVPALTSSAGVFAAEFVSTDLSVFALDPASVQAPAPTGSAPPTGVAVSSVDPRTVGARTAASSSRLDVSWTAPQGDVHHYEVVASESVGGASVSATAASGQARVSLAGLKAATTYAVVVTACRDAACAENGSAAPVTGATDTEYWQLQGTGNTVSGLTTTVADGNARLSATRFGPEAGAMANRIQF